MTRALLACFAFLFLASCGSVSVNEYAAEKPPFDLREYFNGKVDGWGTIQDRSGKITKRMFVEMNCTWVGDTGTFDERFTNSDGTKETRVWTIKKSGSRYTGTAADVVGEAKGEAAGNAFRWQYVLDAKKDGGGTIELDMDDWMWQLDGKTVMNRTSFSKLGIRFGEVSFFFRKRD